jgi:hypothetical protein
MFIISYAAEGAFGPGIAVSQDYTHAAHTDKAVDQSREIYSKDCKPHKKYYRFLAQEILLISRKRCDSNVESTA